MWVGNLSREERLKQELLKIREEARVTQGKLAALSGVSLSTIKAIERCDPRPKAETLRLIADGAATYAPDRRDAELAEAYYDRLLRAAGYIEPQSASPTPATSTELRSPDDWTEEELDAALAKYVGDPEVAASFLSMARRKGGHYTKTEKYAMLSVMQMIEEDEERDRRGAR